MTSGLAFALLVLVATAVALAQGVHLACDEHELQVPEMGRWIRNTGQRTSWHDASDLPASTAGEGAGGHWATFERPLPNMLNREFLDQAEATFNHEQPFVPPSKCSDAHCNDFALEGSPFVVALSNAYVDHDGLVFDSSYVYPIEGMRKWHLPNLQRQETVDAAEERPADLLSSLAHLITGATSKRHMGHGEHMGKGEHEGHGARPGHWEHRPMPSSVICVDKLITILQPYQENYYHFVAESLPRLLMAQDVMRKDPSVRLLTRSQPFIAQFLDKLGISADRVETISQGQVIHAKTLYVPTPTKIFAPPQENLVAVSQQFALDAPAQGPRNLVVYATREGAWSRDVVNERQVIDAMRALLSKTDLELVVFDGSLGVTETINLFQRAIMVIGPHGAGLTNILWTREGTKVVEFLHMSYPLLCYWHMASALGREYWLLPIPESSWAGNMDVPVQEVLEIMTDALALHFSNHTDHGPAGELCPPGTIVDAETGCVPCPPGTFSYRPNSEACTACVAGQYASGTGNTHCSMCPPNSYSAHDGASACTACPPVAGPREPNAPVVWGGKSQDTCPARLRMDDPKFFRLYGVYGAADHEAAQDGHHRQQGMGCCTHWVVAVFIFASLLWWIFR